MKKQLLKSALVAVVGVGLMAGSAGAVLVTVSYTADNIVDTYYLQDYDLDPTISTPDPSPPNLQAGTNRGNWRVSDSFSIDLDAGKKYSLIWAVSNLPDMSPNNPASFLAEINYGGSNYFSDTTWSYSKGGGTTLNFNSQAWKWHPVTSYGFNGGDNIWTTNNSNAAVTGISEQAQWIWSENNFEAGGDQKLYIRADFGADFAPVPEPTTMLLFGSGLLGLAAIARRRRS